MRDLERRGDGETDRQTDRDGDRQRHRERQTTRQAERGGRGGGGKEKAFWNRFFFQGKHANIFHILLASALLNDFRLLSGVP